MEEREIFKMLYDPRLWYKKVDDTYAITSDDAFKTLEELDNKNIKFTIESAKEGKLAILNYLIGVNESR